MDRKMFDTPVLPRLETILAELKSGDLVVPEFQRSFVWDDDRRLNLLDSIAQGMPIGSLLVWRTSRRDLKAYEQVGGIRLAGPRQSGDKLAYLIDGHQRISTLFGALYGDGQVAEDGRRWPVYVDLQATKRPMYRLPPGRGEVPLHWLPLHCLLDGDRLFEATQRLRETGLRDLAKNAERLANVFRDYVIPIVPLVTEDINLVTDAFVRINSQGKPMSEAHMLRALTFLQPTDTDGQFQSIKKQLAPLGWEDLDEQVLVSVLKAQLGLDVYSADVRGVHEKLKENLAPLTGLGSTIQEAVTFLATQGVLGPAVLPYTYQLVTLATLAARSPGLLGKSEHERALTAWFWGTTYSQFFSGITGSKIAEGIEELAATLQAPEPLPSKRPIEIEPLTQVRGDTGRARAFFILLSFYPDDPAASQRRQEWLQVGAKRAAPGLFPNLPLSEPGNRVLANPSELRRLRSALRGDGLSPELADEFAIPQSAVALLPDQEAFIRERSRVLREWESAFIAQFGLRVREDLVPADDDEAHREPLSE